MVGDDLFTAVVVVDKMPPVEPKLVQHGGLVAVRRDDVLDGVMTEVVRATASHAWLDAAARQPHAEPLPVVIATGLLDAAFTLDHRKAGQSLRPNARLFDPAFHAASSP